MRRLLLLVVAAACALAESVIDYTKIPQCARQCAVLAQAEAGCVPPAAPVLNQATYQSCFCNSALLVSLKSSGSQCQSTGCSTDDATKISQYYVSLCNGPVVEPVATTTTATSTAATTTSATGTATAGAAGVVLSNTEAKGNWFTTNWRWVIMVIIMFLAITICWIGAAWLKRRHNRKREAQQANVAARDAPHNPPAPGSERSLPGILRKSRMNGTTAPPPMTMSGGLGSSAMDGGIGGIAPPRPPLRMRSRASTLQSTLGLTNASRHDLPDPVVWGPHQYQAYYNANAGDSSDNSTPPSPNSAIALPHAVFRNRVSAISEPRFVQYRATPTSISVETIGHSSAGGTPGRANGSPSTAATEIERPRTVDAVETGAELEEVTPIRISRAANSSRVVSFDQSDSSLSERVNMEPLSAEICQVTPKKVHEARTRAESIIQQRMRDEAKRAAGEVVEEPQVPEYPPPTHEEIEARIQERLRTRGKPGLPMAH